MRRMRIGCSCAISRPKRKRWRAWNAPDLRARLDGYEMRDARRVVRFFAFDFPALPREWEISVAPRLEKASNELEPVAPTIEIVRSGEDWFELKYSVATDAGEGIPLAEVQRLLALRPEPNPPEERENRRPESGRARRFRASACAMPIRARASRAFTG